MPTPVAQPYKNSVNCRLEHTYAFNASKKGRVNICYVMMDPGYTNCSEPEFVDGWLGLRMGDHLWYPMFDDAHVQGTAESISKFIEEHTDPATVLRRADNQKVFLRENSAPAATAPAPAPAAAQAAAPVAAPAAAASAVALAGASVVKTHASVPVTPVGKVTFDDASTKK